MVDAIHPLDHLCNELEETERRDWFGRGMKIDLARGPGLTEEEKKERGDLRHSAAENKKKRFRTGGKLW
ncbi:hypothetical protein KKH07_00330 [Patescibacteria group bacterium]|nr:hypothetical protein [Patescibacteria group bacterium]MBU1563637.1 hypothetical protein [Patescibacteria group bacterium]